MSPSNSNAGMFQVLHALESALAYTRAAVLAAHPELRESSYGQAPLKLDGAGWIADEILTHLTALSDSIARYCAQADRMRTRATLAALDGLKAPRPGNAKGQAA